MSGWDFFVFGCGVVMMDVVYGFAKAFILDWWHHREKRDAIQEPF